MNVPLLVESPMTYTARPPCRRIRDTSASARPMSHTGAIRETLEHVIIAFILAFTFRAFVVEAFVIPTGSMAPTLLGQHGLLNCPQCGYRFPSGAPQQYGGLACPMCQQKQRQLAGAHYSGDRILVLKFLYAFREPRRWEVVVFKNPQYPPKDGIKELSWSQLGASPQNYIKRLVGLPGEQLQIADGNL